MRQTRTQQTTIVGNTEIAPLATLTDGNVTLHICKINDQYALAVEGEDKGVQAVTAKKPMVKIQYIGKRDQQVEPQFGTGVWETGQIKSMPMDMAIKVLKEYPGVFVKYSEKKSEPEGAAPPETEQEEKPEEEVSEPKPRYDDEQEDELQAARDVVASLDVDGCRKFMIENFSQSLHPAIKSVETARARVIQAIDQYGLP